MRPRCLGWRRACTVAVAAAGVATAVQATTSPCTASGMFGHRFGDKPPAEAKRISQSDFVATSSVAADSPPPFTERVVRIDRARNEIIEVEALATLPAQEAQAWIDAFQRDNPVSPPGTMLPRRGNQPGFAMFLPGHAIAVQVYPGPRPTDPVQLSLSCQRHRPG